MNRNKLIREKILRQQAIRDAAVSDGNRNLTLEEQEEFNKLQREIELLTIPVEADKPEPHSQSGGESNVRESAITAERERITNITSLCRDFDINPEQYIANGNSMDEVRTAVLNQIRQGQVKPPLSTSGTLSVENDEAIKFRAAASDALVLRAGQTVENPAEGARELCSMSLRDLAIETLAREEGENTSTLLRTSSDELYSKLTRSFYNPTAAFPAILDASIKKSIVDIYDEVPTTFQKWTSKGSLKDFKETSDHEYVLGGGNEFLKVPENGELKNDVLETELLPSRKIETYGLQFSMSRQAFINDDIGFITKIPGLYARKAKMTQDKQVYSILFDNSKIFDGINMFHEKHNNLVSSGQAPSVEALQTVIKKMQLQTDNFKNPIYIIPKYIIVPIGYAFDLKVILESTHLPGSSNNDINPLNNYPIEVIETPMLNALAGQNAIPWFVVADKSTARSIQVDYLNGQEIPTFRRAEQAGTLGFVWDIYHDWGINVVDYRGIARNNGVKMS